MPRGREHQELAEREGSKGPPTEAEDAAVNDVLRAISHEFNNHIHRFYLLSDRLRGEAAATPEACETAGEIEALLPDLEGLVNDTVAYFAPLRSRATVFETADIVQSLHACTADLQVELSGEESCRDCYVSADPGLLSAALRMICERLEQVLGPGATVHGSLRKNDVAAVLEICLRLPADSKAGAAGGLSMALAAKYVSRQGGHFTEETTCGDSGASGRTWIVALPLASETSGENR